MPLDTGAAFTTEKNLQENRPIFLYRIHDYNGSDDLLLTAYDEDVEFDSETYTKFPISHESISDNSQNEIDTVQARLSNVTREIQSYLELYDWRGKKVTITQVFADQLDDPDAKLVFVFYVDNYSANESEVLVTLTTKFDVLDVQLPLGLYYRSYCRWKFKSAECGYSGSETVCNKTKQDCKGAKNNYARFGGFPSIPQRRLFT